MAKRGTSTDTVIQYSKPTDSGDVVVESYARIKAMPYNQFKAGYDLHHHIKGCAWCKVMWYWQSNINLIPRRESNKHGFSNIPNGYTGLGKWYGIW